MKNPSLGKNQQTSKAALELDTHRVDKMLMAGNYKRKCTKTALKIFVNCKYQGSRTFMLTFYRNEVRTFRL